ncbi:hypothetical protein ACN20G_07495 [Streptomyces sp. BI20]|uniref:hypothetical protein n=1 Tax=Streptomyces sp. BI20 TaxID=3403460 RepID=UPI003C72833D
MSTPSKPRRRPWTPNRPEGDGASAVLSVLCLLPAGLLSWNGFTDPGAGTWMLVLAWVLPAAGLWVAFRDVRAWLRARRERAAAPGPDEGPGSGAARPTLGP